MTTQSGGEEQRPIPFLPENETEITRQLLQHRYLMKLIGNIVPESLDLSNVHRVLDVACGVGGWVFDMAWRHPDIQVIGIDRSAYFIAEARKLVEARYMDNASFLVQDMHQLEGTQFTPGSFDLIHLSFFAGDVSPREFPPLLQALARLCRLEGIIMWQEAELPLTNSLACERLGALVLEALKAAGRNFTPRNSLGITPLMGYWLRNVGYRIAQSSAYAIDVSTGTEANRSFLQQVRVFGHQVRTFLLTTGVTTEVVFEDVFSQTQKDIQAETFCGLIFLRTVTGIKQSGASKL